MSYPDPRSYRHHPYEWSIRIILILIAVLLWVISKV